MILSKAGMDRVEVTYKKYHNPWNQWYPNYFKRSLRGSQNLQERALQSIWEMDQVVFTEPIRLVARKKSWKLKINFLA